MLSRRGRGNYFIKPDYRARLDNQYFIDITTKDLVFQPEVYELVDYLAERSGATHIIDVGAGNGLKLKPLTEKYKLIAIDHKSNMDELRSNLPGHQCLEADLEKGLPRLPKNILKKSIVVSADVIEHLKRPDKYLQDLAHLSHQVPFLLLSTPDRVRVRGIGDCGPPGNPAHVREWSLEELYSLLANYGFAGLMAGYTINTNQHRRKSTSLLISGTDVYHENHGSKVEQKAIQAIITLYNDAEIIDQVIDHLLQQGVDVHIVDNWSSDGGYELVKSKSAKTTGLSYERYPIKKPKYYEWEKLLLRVDDIAAEGSYDWYLHHDADELRLSPWPGISLRQAISFVDSRGYNALDFTVLDFRPTKDGFGKEGKLEEFFTHCEFGKRPGHFVQKKAWKSAGKKVGLAETGGHEVIFENRRTYPLKFITKHYPLRSTKQAQRKIFSERLPRLSPAEKKKGWHIHYDSFGQKDNFIWPEEMLLQFYPPTFFAEYLVELISGIGVNRTKT